MDRKRRSESQDPSGKSKAEERKESSDENIPYKSKHPSGEEIIPSWLFEQQQSVTHTLDIRKAQDVSGHQITILSIAI